MNRNSFQPPLQIHVWDEYDGKVSFAKNISRKKDVAVMPDREDNENYGCVEVKGVYLSLQIKNIDYIFELVLVSSKDYDSAFSNDDRTDRDRIGGFIGYRFFDPYSGLMIPKRTRKNYTSFKSAIDGLKFEINGSYDYPGFSDYQIKAWQEIVEKHKGDIKCLNAETI